MCTERELIELRRAARKLRDVYEFRDTAHMTDSESTDARLATLGVVNSARVLLWAAEDLARAVDAERVQRQQKDEEEGRLTKAGTPTESQP